MSDTSTTNMTTQQRADLADELKKQIAQMDKTINDSGLWSLLLVEVRMNRSKLQSALNSLLGTEDLTSTDYAKINQQLADAQFVELKKDSTLSVRKGVTIALIVLVSFGAIWYFIIRARKKTSSN